MAHLGKRLAYVLRHQPGAAGVTLDPAGWVALSVLAAGLGVSEAAIRDTAAADEKGRFTLSPDGRRIRAAQGHSVAVELDLPRAHPPDRLYHGTVARFLPAIRAEGLKPGSRTHVHLSADAETATRVGSRRGKPVILVVRAGELAAAGHAFHLSENGVWLTSHVPPDALEEG